MRAPDQQGKFPAPPLSDEHIDCRCVNEGMGKLIFPPLPSGQGLFPFAHSFRLQQEIAKNMSKEQTHNQ
jgi:hypothetical protein